MNFEKYIQMGITLAMSYVPKLLLALVTLVVGLWIVKWVARIAERTILRAKVDASLSKFLVSFVSTGLKILLLISVASMLGVATTSFVALLGAAGLAVGLALQGSLGNFAGGVLILLFRPYKVGDLIEAHGSKGVVKEIEIFNTIITTLDNKTVIVPNGMMSATSIVNYNTEPLKRVDITFGIGYGDDIAKAKAVLKDLAESHAKVLKTPESEFYVSELADSSVNLLVRLWCKTEDYWAVFFYMQEQVKLSFDKEGISIPFPQRDVHINQK